MEAVACDRQTPCSRRAFLAASCVGTLGLLRPYSALANCAPEDDDPLLLPQPTGRVLRVTPGQPLMSLAATARAARDGDTIEVESGTYPGDVSSWPQSDLTIRGIGPRPRLIADGKDAEGKGIMVLKGRRVRIENLEFRGARVRDRNGAGIRVEDGPVTVSDCAFLDNENGILTGNMKTIEIAIEHSIFDGNGNAEGSAHNLYVGTIASLNVTGCLFAQSRVGHLLKSRAELNSIRYSRLTGEGATSSYELEFPNGGRAIVMGNLIQQGPATENSTVVSYGAEGYRWPENKLVMVFNTIVNDRTTGGTFVRVFEGAQMVTLANNLLVGPGSLSIDSPLESLGNLKVTKKEFADPVKFDYRLQPQSSIMGRAGFRGASISDAQTPTREYVHPASSCPLKGLRALTPLSPGAFQSVAR